MTSTRGSAAARPSAIAPVPSGEASSTISTRAAAGAAARRARTIRATCSASQYVGRTIQAGPRMRGRVG
jgi:hypothetical protein